MPRNLPSYRQLPALSNGLRISWGVFGAADDLGTVNFLDRETVQAASHEIMVGQRINMTLSMREPDPQLAATRSTFRHSIFYIAEGVQDDVLDNFFLQGSAQWDGLRRRREPFYGVLYRHGRSRRWSVGTRLGIEAWAEVGLVGAASWLMPTGTCLTGSWIMMPRWAIQSM
jgi:hypothetical protein